jgi:membrane dipeptidase|tara:strand:- start:2185 stop:3438 length:1254 start_codon:yes stop_codon:yes gene_type:complete
MKICFKIGIIFMTLLFACSGEQSKKSQDNDPLELRERAHRLSQKIIITDGHVDLPYRMAKKGFMSSNSVEDVSIETVGDFDYPKAKIGGLDAPFMSIYVPAAFQKSGGAKAFADSLIDMVGRLPQAFPNLFASAGSPSEVKGNFEKALISLPLGMENGAPIESDLANVKYFFDRGIRYITLTHSLDNEICDSSYDTSEDTWDGLSPFGEQVVQEMNKWGIMIDVSHISDKAFYDVMNLTQAPVIASHSSCRKFTPGFMRNMNDDMIKLLAKKGGVIQINFGSSFLSKTSQDQFSEIKTYLDEYRATQGLLENDSTYVAYAAQYLVEMDPFEEIKTVADHIDHVVAIAGIDYVGLGSDFDGVGNSLPKGLKDVSMYPNLIYELLMRGYSDEDVEKICSQNVFRVWEETLSIASKIQTL